MSRKNQVIITLILLAAVSLSQSSTPNATSLLCPEQCLCDTVMKQVSCNSGLLTSVPKGIPSDTLILSLDNNLISELQPNDFDDLGSLEKLFINNNAITSIANSTFRELNNLVELSLNSNQIAETINVDTFSGLQRLEVLQMSQIHSPGMVPCIDDFAFSQLSSLKTLILTNNDLYFISKDLFTGLANLTKLHITLNLFSKIDSDAFSGINSNTSNTSLMVDLGPFNTGVCCCSTYQAIRTLLHHTNTSCNEFCFDVKGICDIQYNTTCIKKPNIQSQPDSSSLVTRRIPTSTPAVTLDTILATPLSENMITSTIAPSYTIDPTTLMDQTASSKITAVTTIEPEPQRPTTARTKGMCPDLCICHDEFQTVICQKHLLRVPRDLPSETRKLILNGNLISRISKYDFYDLFNLEMLYLHNNKIQKIDDGSFEDLHNLKQLFLLSNEIKSITKDTFKGLNSLTTLWLSNLNSKNDLVTITDGSFGMLGSLESLIINGNKFVAFTDNTFKGLTNLNLLQISIHLLKVISTDAFDCLPRNATIRTDPYDIEVCCCSSSIALNDTRINRKSLKIKCTELTCIDDDKAIDVCKMKFSSTTSNHTESPNNQLSSTQTITATSFNPPSASIMDSDIYHQIQSISIILSTGKDVNPTQSVIDQKSKGSDDMLSVRNGDQGFLQKQNTNNSITTMRATTANSNNTTLKPPVKIAAVEWGNDKNSATILSGYYYLTFITIMSLFYY